MPDISQPTWSETDASNSQPAPNGWPEGMPPSGVNDAARMMMGAVKRWWDRSNPVVTTTGGANTYVYATADASFPTAYVQGEIFTFRPHQTNTGSATFQVNSLGAKPIKRIVGGVVKDVVAGEIGAFQTVSVFYDNGNNGFIMASAPAVYAGRGALVRRGSDLTIASASATTIAWGTRDYDTDGLWSPGAPTTFVIPSGVSMVRVSVNVSITTFSGSSAGIRGITIAKNGSVPAGGGRMIVPGVAVNPVVLYIHAITAPLQVSPGDTFSALVEQTTGLNATLNANENTWFACEIIR